MSNFFKICPVGAELLHVEGQTDIRTDMTKLIVAVRNFANAFKNEKTDLLIFPTAKFNKLGNTLIT